MSIARRRRNYGGKLPIRAVGIGLLAGLVVVGGCLMTPTKSKPRQNQAGVPIVRVRLLAKTPTVNITLDGAKQTIAVGDVRSIRTLTSSTDQPITVEGHRYSGEVRLVPVDASGFDVINVITIDDYVEGVVPKEMYATWPANALKAQAIAARTYALYQIQTRTEGTGTFDVHNDVRSQVYGGLDATKETSSRAVEETRGIVLTYGPAGAEKIFCTYFSSTCGGTTASGKDVFDDPSPPLRDRSSDGCVDSPRYRWPEFSIRKDELTRRVKLWGQRNQMSIANLGKIKSVEVFQRTSLGRPTRFVVTDENGRRYTLAAEQMRNAANADGPEKPQFLSSFFTPVDAGESIRITSGGGWGHGVGMCQYCVFGWSKRGMNYSQILKQSYPGAVLVRAY